MIARNDWTSQEDIIISQATAAVCIVALKLIRGVKTFFITYKQIREYVSYPNAQTSFKFANKKTATLWFLSHWTQMLHFSEIEIAARSFTFTVASAIQFFKCGWSIACMQTSLITACNRRETRED